MYVYITTRLSGNVPWRNFIKNMAIKLKSDFTVEYVEDTTPYLALFCELYKRIDEDCIPEDLGVFFLPDDMNSTFKGVYMNFGGDEYFICTTHALQWMSEWRPVETEDIKTRLLKHMEINNIPPKIIMDNWKQDELATVNTWLNTGAHLASMPELLAVYHAGMVYSKVAATGRCGENLTVDVVQTWSADERWQAWNWACSDITEAPPHVEPFTEMRLTYKEVCRIYGGVGYAPSLETFNSFTLDERQLIIRWRRESSDFMDLPDVLAQYHAPSIYQNLVHTNYVDGTLTRDIINDMEDTDKAALYSFAMFLQAAQQEMPLSKIKREAHVPEALAPYMRW